MQFTVLIRVSVLSQTTKDSSTAAISPETGETTVEKAGFRLWVCRLVPLPKLKQGGRKKGWLTLLNHKGPKLCILKTKACDPFRNHQRPLSRCTENKGWKPQCPKSWGIISGKNKGRSPVPPNTKV